MSKSPETARSNSPQFRKEDRREFRYVLSVACALTLSWVFWLVPGRLRGAFADRCGDLFYRASSTYPRNVAENVGVVQEYMGESGANRDAIVRSIFRTSARNFMDLIIIPRHNPRTFNNAVQVVSGSISTLDEMLRQGKGGILITAHTGCFDYIGQALAIHGFPLTVVTGRTTSRFIFDGVTWLRASHQLKMVEPTPSGVRNVMRAVRRNEFAVFVADRDFFQNGHDVVFMGRKTTLPPGPIRIARETGAPVVSVFSRRVPKGHEMSIGEPFQVARTADMRADMATGMARLVTEIESGITASLDQWAMFQRVWLEEERMPVRVFPVGSPLESELLERVATALPEKDHRQARASREHPAAGEAGPTGS